MRVMGFCLRDRRTGELTIGQIPNPALTAWAITTGIRVADLAPGRREELVLKGFSNALANGMIDVIQFEYGKVNILTRFLLRDIYEMLEGYGYTVGKLYPNYVEFRHYTLDDENFFGPNYVAILKDRRELVEAVS